ncbi:DUF4249 domain-containing protein [Sporocytophaga myxococcoides]|uniref:DUF4249 domain-containing protein n=1 Tax=Sporocytophaga myxococcoides TaxID=153721 RepID=UPI000429F154|nr:DUF4249 domain-containing protein [Sporocytophaga myxococcoides]
MEMKFSRFAYIAFVSALSFLISSCEKVIDLKLKNSEAGIVIEGAVTDQPGPYRVKISRKVNFDQPNVFPAVSGASVIISDNIGSRDTLKEVRPGVYETNSIVGVAGNTYTLSVGDQGNTYTGQSVMPSPVAIDSISIDYFLFGGPDTAKFVKVTFKDPQGVKNYYRILEVFNGDTLKGMHLEDDNFRDGQKITQPVFEDGEDGNFQTFKSGDVVTILLLSIDENTYKYLRGVEAVTDGGQSASPANPPSNLSRPALGCFSAHSFTSRTIIVK